MIETKEQYEQLREILDFGNWEGDDIKREVEMLETIEALREVVRAAAYVTPSYADSNYDSPGTLALIEKLDALPDWIKED